MGQTTRKLIDCYCTVAALINPPWLSEQVSSLVILSTKWIQTPYIIHTAIYSLQTEYLPSAKLLLP